MSRARLSNGAVQHHASTRITVNVDTYSTKLVRVLERILTDHDWQQAERAKGERQLEQLALRLLDWDGKSEELS